VHLRRHDSCARAADKQIERIQSNSTCLEKSFLSVSACHRVKNPKKLLILTPPTGVVDGTTWPSPIMTGPYSLTNLNVKVNGTRQYNSDLSSLYELWEELKKSMPPSISGMSTSSQLTFSDFVKTHRIHYLDISRYSHRVSGDPNALVSISVTANPTSATAVDIIYLIEREIECEIHFGHNEVKVTPNI